MQLLTASLMKGLLKRTRKGPLVFTAAEMRGLTVTNINAAVEIKNLKLASGLRPILNYSYCTRQSEALQVADNFMVRHNRRGIST